MIEFTCWTCKKSILPKGSASNAEICECEEKAQVRPDQEISTKAPVVSIRERLDLEPLNMVDNRPSYVKQAEKDFIEAQNWLGRMHPCSNEHEAKIQFERGENMRFKQIRAEKIIDQYDALCEYSEETGFVEDLPIPSCTYPIQKREKVFCGSLSVSFTEGAEARCNYHAGINGEKIKRVFGELSPEAEERLYPRDMQAFAKLHPREAK